MNIIIKNFFGIIKWYDNNKQIGIIQSHEKGDAEFKPISFTSNTDIELIKPNMLVLFSLKKNVRGRNIAQDITLDYYQFVQTNYRKFDKSLVEVILSYGNQETKNWLRSKLDENNQELNIESFDFFRTILKNNTTSYVDALLNNLAEGLGEINSVNNYMAAVQLLNYNLLDTGKERLPNLPYNLYQKANKNFKFKLWLEGHISFCNLEIIKRKFELADDVLKLDILSRCQGNEKGFLINEISDSREIYRPLGIEDVYFEGIRDVIICEIKNAKKNIFVAVAWFTNHHFLEALCEKVKEGVHVEIMILNDYINNWIEGLDFQKFIDLGKENRNSAFYFCGIDNIMHHKFCIIDEDIVFNGSYNWTYYAEHRNYENCMVFRHSPNIIEKFISEFEKIKSMLTPVEKIIPFDRDSKSIIDLFSCKQYRSKDLEYKAKEAKSQNNIGLASRLAQISLQINPENEEAIRFQQEIRIKDEETIRKVAIQKEISEKQIRQQSLNREIEEQEIKARLQQEKERERRENELKAKLEEEKLHKEKLAKQEEEQRRLQKQEEEIKAKKELEEQEKIRIAELEKQRKILLEIQEKEQQEREEKQRAEEQKRIEEQKQFENEQRKQKELIAQKEAEIIRLEEESTMLETSKATILQGNRGKLRINLQWQTLDDLDLHVYDPDNNHIFYQKKEATCQNSVGKLDVDANAGGVHTKTPQENIFWENDAPEGTYKVEVNFYTKRELEECPFIVTIIPEIGESKVYSSKVIGVKSTVFVSSFTYNKNEGMKIISNI